MPETEDRMDFAQLNALCRDDSRKDDQPNAQVPDLIASPTLSPMLKKNLEAMGIKSPVAAQRIANTPQIQPDRLRFIMSDEGIESAELDGIALASKRKPMQEAKRLSERIDPTSVACCAILGFGIGYHCGAMLERLGGHGIVVCFEPDVALLRAVLERVDYSAMLATNRFFLVTDPDDSASLSRMFSGIEAIVGLGVEIIKHPPSMARLGESGDRFGRVLSDVLKSARTHVITTLAHAPLSFRNSLMNLDYYSKSAGILALKDSCAGKPAVVVSAGPSLEKNLDLLADPAVRQSVVVVAVQTVLKVMLNRRIKPDFVAALDFHEISTRFYEGLTAADVEGIRLVVEPKANPAILDAFPGEVLCVNDELLDTLLGDKLACKLGEVPRGGTVAHLCYYLARYLGCDPVILIGQDLGFTDGQYYAAGAAIHQVWSGELNAHNTLEMMEWERIARMKSLLRKKTDIHGRAIYCDEQMSTYLAQFEADFQKDEEKGLVVIDATEGGVAKAHTTIMTLRKAIDTHASTNKIEIPETSGIGNQDDLRKQLVGERLKELISDCERVAYLSEESIKLLESMIRHQQDQKKVNTLIRKVEGLRDRVVAMEAAFTLIESVNQVGVINRMRRDRVIEMSEGVHGLERQKMQIERDITNVQWTRDAARSVAELLAKGRSAFFGELPKQTNELDEMQAAERTLDIKEGDGDSHERAMVHAVVIADPQFGGLGTGRDLRSKMFDGLNILQTTLRRLDRSSELDGITIVTPNPDAIRAIIGSFSVHKDLRIVGVDPDRFAARARRIASARMQSGACWRGSIGRLSVYDEQVDPGLLASVMGEYSFDACAIVGVDWAMIDPGLVDLTVARFRTQDSEKRIAFSQAVPGIGTMVIDRATMALLGNSMNRSDGGTNHFATIGALVGYIPVSPQSDPIAKGMCVHVEPSIRDAGVRAIADTPARIAVMQDAYQAMDSNEQRDSADAARCVDAFACSSGRYGRVCPSTIVLETCTGRLAGGDWGMWKRNSIKPIERPVLSIGDAHRLLGGIGELREDVAVVFDGVGDPLMHPRALDFVHLAKEDGIGCVEVRTDLLREGIGAGELLESGIDILSVDVLAETPETYASITGVDRLDAVYTRLQSIFDAMGSDPSNPIWFVPRITRCDAVYSEIEPFFDKWLMLCGSAVIDPLPQRIDGQRIQRLPIPKKCQRRVDRSTMHVCCDGTVVDRLGHPIGGAGRAINALDEGIEQAYRRMCSAMRASSIEPKGEIRSLTQEPAA
jgi:hypothetical protein